MQIIRGTEWPDRVKVRVATAAVVFEEQRLLLIRRADSGDWALPSGRVDPGEAVTGACLRELKEETNVVGQIIRLMGIFSDPTYLIEYSDGELIQPVCIAFHVRNTKASGIRLAHQEAIDARWYQKDEIGNLTINELHRPRIAAAFNPAAWPVID